MIRGLLIIALLAITGFAHADDPQDSTPATAGSSEPVPLAREIILSSISTNSDKRCVGISVVAEALLDGVALEEDGCDEAASVADQIYDSLTTKQQLRYRPDVMVEGVCVPLISKAAIDKLGTLVADKYKRDFSRLMSTEEGRQTLLTAQDSFVATLSELERILDADPDKVDVFIGSGTRLFPDGTVELSYHAFLIGKEANGDMVVYDANDPGSPIKCKLWNCEQGVAIGWTCSYRDTGHTTTQYYLFVHKDRFFQVMLGE